MFDHYTLGVLFFRPQLKKKKRVREKYIHATRVRLDTDVGQFSSEENLFICNVLRINVRTPKIFQINTLI